MNQLRQVRATLVVPRRLGMAGTPIPLFHYPLTLFQPFRNVTDNRVFWKIIKPKISNKFRIRSKITFAENHKILSQNVEITKTVKEYFTNVPILNI